MEPGTATPAPEHAGLTGRHRLVTPALYAAAILFGVFLFPRIAVIGYLAVGIRSVFVVGERGPSQSELRLADPEAMDSLVAASRSVWRLRTPT